MTQRNRRSATKRAPRRLTTARPRERRGVLLLVVLSLLVLFLLFGSTFLITSGQYRTATRVLDKATRTTFQPADVLERALMQLLRDTNNPNSVVRYHSLLRDLYGVDGFVGRPMQADARSTTGFDIPILQDNQELIAAPHYAGVTTLTAPTDPLGPTQGQLIEFYVYDDARASRLDPSDRNTVGLDFGADGQPVEHQLPSVDGYYNGAVLTFVTGPCRGSSVRVVDYDHLQTVQAGNQPVPITRFRTTAPRRADGRPLLPDATGALADLVDLNPSSSTSTTHGHRFVVNGRPFNGSGVGFNPLALSHDLAQSTPPPRLSALELFVDSSRIFHYGMEQALIPNSVYYEEGANVSLDPSQGADPWGLAYRGGNYNLADFIPLTRGFVGSGTPGYNAETSPLYRTFAGPGDTDESYDAPDSQNMALALQAPEPRLRGRVVNAAGQSLDPAAYYANGAAPAPAYLDLNGVTIPSFHRPALANFWFHRLVNSPWLQGLIGDASVRARAVLQPYDPTTGQPQFGLSVADAATLVGVKRKFLLRPLREDHPDFDGSNALSRYDTPAMRAAFTGAGLVNPTGEITFPFWEAVGPWDVDNDGDGVPDSVWVDLGLPVQKTEDGRWYKPLVAMLVEDLDGRLNLNAHGSADDLVGESLDASEVVVRDDVFQRNLAQDFSVLPLPALPKLLSSDQLPTGEGWGPAEVSLRSILSPDLSLASLAALGERQYDDYARLLAGRPDPALGNRVLPPAVAALGVAEPFGRYGSYGAFDATPQIPDTALAGVEAPRPGRSYTLGSQAVREATTDPRTRLENPGAPEYLTTPTDPTTAVDLPSGFSSPPDWRGRYASGLSIVGAPVSEAVNAVNLQNPNLTWRQDARNTPNDSPYELDLSAAAGRLAPVSLSAIRRSYDANGDRLVDDTAAPLNDDAPFSAAELERLLRALDADATSLPDRLWNLVDAFDPIKLAAATRLESAIANGDETNPPAATTLDAVAAAAKAAINRRSVTTDSWDLPVPNESWGERLALGADGLPGVPWSDTNLSGFRDAGDAGDDDGDGLFDEGDEAVVGFNGTGHQFRSGVTLSYDRLAGLDPPDPSRGYQPGDCDDYVVVMRRDPPASPRLVDFLRYRITLELLRKRVVDNSTPLPMIDRHVDEILRGCDPRPVSLVRGRTNTQEGIDSSRRHGVDMNQQPPLFSYGGLIAPELIAGLRMNLNRPLGDGRDNGNGVDDDGNGLIDDPAEMLPRDPNPNATDKSPWDSLLNGVVDEPGEAGEPAVGEYVNGVFVPTNYLDWNNNGIYDPPRDVLGATDLNGDGSYLTDPSTPFGTVGAAYDPNEVTPFDYTAGAEVNGRGAYLSNNADGVYTNGDELVVDNGPHARQLLARHLYCLMLALMDENYVAPYDPNDLQAFEYLNPEVESDGAYPIAEQAYLIEFDAEIRNESLLSAGQQIPLVANGQLTDRAHTIELENDNFETRRQIILVRARTIAQRKLTRRMIAQWAINVVDFRDPDAIQTPFEYDENPWDGWNVVDTRGTATPTDDNVYPLDGDLSTDESLRQIRNPDRNTDADRDGSNDGFGFPVKLHVPNESGRVARNDEPILRIDQTRGVVWGAERPELLLTEGLAWHDRRAVDAEIILGDLNGNSQEDPEEFDGGKIGSGDGDDDLDQIVRPKGFVYLEAYNPWVGDPQRPAEFYTGIDRDGVRRFEPGLRFDRLSDERYDTDDLIGSVRSPVWRLAVVEEDPRLRNTTMSRPNNEGAALSPGAFYWLSDDPDPFSNDLDLDYDFIGKVDAGDPQWEKLPDVWSKAGFDDLEPYFSLSVERQRRLAVTLSRSSIAPVTDSDGLLVALGLRERPLMTPDTSFPGFNRFALPRQLKEPAEVRLSSTIDGNNGQVNRLRFAKPLRHIERAIYPVTPLAASGQSRRFSNNPPRYPFPNTEFSELRRSGGGQTRYDASGYRLPVSQIEVRLPSRSPLTTDGLWNFSAGESAPVDRSTEPTGQAPDEVSVLITTNRFAAFDWFDVDGDGDRVYDDVGEPTGPAGEIEALELAPLLPGRRAVIGTQGMVYDNSRVTEISGGNYTDQAWFDQPDPASDIRGPFVGSQSLAGRFTTLTSATPDSFNWETDPSNPANPSEDLGLIRRLGRFEMIPSSNPNVHQFAVRMNGLAESAGAYRNNTLSSNLSVAPAVADASLRTGPPVVAVPIDNFSISEPIDQYLLRAFELERTDVPTTFTRRDLITAPLPRNFTNEFLFAEGYFQRGDAFGYDEPFDVLPELIRNQTTPNYRSVHLERLANPLMPWNPAPYTTEDRRLAATNLAGSAAPPQHDPSRPVNPYLPVDALPLDLTALNTLGREGIADRGNGKFTTGLDPEQLGPEFLHTEPRVLPQLPASDGTRPTTPATRNKNPFAPRSVERDRPAGPFRQLWGATVGRLLWRQARPTTASELVIGTDKISRLDRLSRVDSHGPIEIPTVTVDNLPPLELSLGGGATPIAGNGFDFSSEYDQVGIARSTPLSVLFEPPNRPETNRLYQFGWRMSLGFASPWMGQPLLGSSLGWRGAPGFDPDRLFTELVDLDGDGDLNELDLLGFGAVVDALSFNPFTDANANGRPDVLDAIDWNPVAELPVRYPDPSDIPDGLEEPVGVVDAYEAAQDPQRERSATPELHWPNRPFVNAGELLQVPVWGGSRMLTHFSAFNWLHTQGPEFWHHTQINPYNGEAAILHDGLDYANVLAPDPTQNNNAGAGAFNGNFADEAAPDRRDTDDFLDYRATNELRFRETLGHFGHLANFFQTARYPAFVQDALETRFEARNGLTNAASLTPAVPPTATQVPRGASHFYRVLDYVHVPTPFTGQSTLLNPDAFGPPAAAPGDVRKGLTAPFNQISDYREPGRVNLNTVVGRRDPAEALDWWSEVYDGLMHRAQDTSRVDLRNGVLLKMGHLGPAWRDVALSRRGYVQSTFDPSADRAISPDDINESDDSVGALNGQVARNLAGPSQNLLDYSPRRLHPDFPTFFANPFRAPGEGANVPLAHMVQTGVDATLLRAHPLSPGADGAWGRRGVDDSGVDKGGADATRMDNDLVRDDASEAGFLTPVYNPDATNSNQPLAVPATIELGGGSEDQPTMDAIDRLGADVVLARFRHTRQDLLPGPPDPDDPRSRSRGALPDTFLESSLRPTLADPEEWREASPQQSVALGLFNTEIGRRVTPVPLFSGATLEPSLDTERNATKRFEPIQRMSGLATTRSNAYAVWITVGFFEVKPAAEDPRLWPRYMTDADNDGIGDTFLSGPPGAENQIAEFFFKVYPEGWTLGRELGLDTGTNQRHRGFYVIDRSRPVAFRPGDDANVSETVLVRRRLE